MNKSNSQIAIIILAAGKGTRMKSPRAKVMHAVGGRSLIGHVLDSALLLGDKIVTVLSDSQEEVAAEVKSIAPNAEIAIQKQQLGTANAVADALSCLGDFNGTIIVLYGDTPFIDVKTISKMVNEIEAGNAVSILGFQAKNAGSYGRIIVESNELKAIIEYKDASESQRDIKFCNSGVMAIDGSKASDLIAQIGNDNAKNEYYLTDILEIAKSSGSTVSVITADEAEVIGINSQADRAVAEKYYQDKLRAKFMEEGVILIAPETVFFSYDTFIGAGTTIHPNVVFGSGVKIASNVEVKSFSHIEGAQIESGASIGPYARLRPEAKIGKNAKIGNFVEIKKSDINAGAKISHLSYIGDASVGADANIGAGVVTCNYDGANKHKTFIGAGAFIGSNSSIIAPLTIGDNAVIGAGSTVLKDVAINELAINDMKQINRKK